MQAVPRAVVLVLPLLLAGCFATETRLSASASGALVARGFGYDGNISATEGSITINVVDESNTGRVQAQWRELGNWTVDWDNFSEAPDKLYQNGGIVFGIEAHGDTGNGDANLPHLHYVAAGWGIGKVQQNGKDFADPLTGSTDFKLHFMALRDGIREPGTNKILKADGSSLYDPATSGDGKTYPGRPEAHLLVQSTAPGAPGRVDVVGNISSDVNEPAHSKAYKIVAPEAITRVKVYVNLTTTTPGGAIVGQLNVALRSPAGRTVDQKTLGGAGTLPNQPRNVTLEHGTPTKGNYSLLITGGGANLHYEGTGVLTVGPRAPFVRLISYEGAEIKASGPHAN